jgi:pimeloyl-ACP methyl ester carboxylesterase
LKAELLVSTEALAAHLGDPDWIVFDTRHDLAWPDKGRQAYQAAHIPGARRRVLPGLGHAPHLSRPALVNELLAGFLAELV